MVLFIKSFYDGDMPQKVKAATSSDLRSWVDARQEQGLYFFTREEDISTLPFIVEAFKKAAARLAKKTEFCAAEAAFSSSFPMARLIENKDPPFTRLDPSLPTGKAEKNTRWRLLINTDVEGDL
jgi:hypothetical protein